MTLLATAAPEPDPGPRVTAGRRTAHGLDVGPSLAGRIAHSVIADLIHVTAPDELEILAVARLETSRAAEARGLNQRRIGIVAGTGASAYLQRLRPTRATVLGVEMSLPNSSGVPVSGGVSRP